MPSIFYGSGAYKRATGSLPPVECINLFVESAETSDKSVCLQSRPGLTTTQTNGSGPINGLYAEKGVFGGDDFSVSGGNIYRVTTSLGTVAGSGIPSFAGTATELLVARGSTLRRYNGSTLNNPTFPDAASVTAVCVINFLFVAARAGGTYPGRFYWSAVNDGDTWDSLDYATAERVPDDLLDIVALGDNIWLFGQSSLEVWQNTGNAALPFTRIEQVAFDRGIIDTGAWAKADNTIFFIGSDAVVYRVMPDNPVAVSEPWLNEKIREATSWRMFSFKRDGEEFVVVRLGTTTGSTYVLPVSTGTEWCEFQTNGGQWIAQCGAMKGTTAYLGHQSTGAIMGFSGWQDLGVAMERRFTAAIPLDEPLSVNRLRLWANAGQAPTGVTPTVSLRYSRDAGQTWSSYLNADLGNATDDGTGDYRAPTEWRRLGMFDEPGAMFEIKASAAMGFRISAVKMNDGGGGRSRV